MDTRRGRSLNSARTTSIRTIVIVVSATTLFGLLFFLPSTLPHHEYANAAVGQVQREQLLQQRQKYQAQQPPHRAQQQQHRDESEQEEDHAPALTPPQPVVHAKATSRWEGEIIVWAMRHGQAEHNLSGDGLKIRDPLLTGLGKQQALTASRLLLEHRAAPTLLVSSPLKRTIQSSLLAFSFLFADTAQTTVPLLLLHPDLQELNSVPCDTGVARVELQHQVEQQGFVPELKVERYADAIDYSRLVDEWYQKDGRLSDSGCSSMPFHSSTCLLDSR
jgi:hypothetical protein